MSRRLVQVAEPIPSLRVLERAQLGDARGFLERIYDAGDAAAYPGSGHVAQVNRTVTLRKGVVRGMHFQRPPYSESKLVHCVRGAVFDVAVDLRVGSPTFLRWHGEILSDANRRCLWIPEGFAHGFQTLEDECEMLYVHSQAYQPDHEDGLHPCDPRIGITWPLNIIQMSDRDQRHSMIDEHFEGVRT